MSGEHGSTGQDAGQPPGQPPEHPNEHPNDEPDRQPAHQPDGVWAPDRQPPARPAREPWQLFADPDTPARKPRRKRVVLADSRRRGRVLRTIIDLEEQTSVGEKLVEDLVRTQAKAAFGLAALVVGALGALPLAFYLFPPLAEVSLAGVRLPWLLLAVLPYPVLYAIGHWYRRLAEANEKDFVNTVDRN
ncbi:hypothetical protein [Goodfellowiella coeruleoviolacea]|uniref:DUF485 domain-containing protein n=1 Tax=Goodfellowiella coeruleoviolacea TaxID=334858 RepID=A0AAE3KQ10_9PSEU|nr:hypothetical protein [Goodfellowiella coeruleoviolacea]MCP2170453.1 hypothetical protein [Goodfellowiella coeruleoviolacea]